MNFVPEDAMEYSVPLEAQKIFKNELLNNPLLPELPSEIHAAAKAVHFQGHATPSIPINWRFAESVAALKALEASMLNVLRVRKFPGRCQISDVNINTDHASLFFMSPMINQIIGSDGPQPMPIVNAVKMAELGFPSTDLHGATDSLHKALATNIYRTEDNRYYHLHGSMNPSPTLEALNVPSSDGPRDTIESVVAEFQAAAAKFTAQDLDARINEQYRQAGTIALSIEEFVNSEHGKANDHVGLYEIHKSLQHGQAASWWPENVTAPSLPSRPLAGLKVVDLTRVIAAPAITRSLAEMGASVMRVTSEHVADMSALHADLNWGKWNCNLHLKSAEDVEKLKALIRDADVVVEGYRPSVMEKYGLSREHIFDLVKDRERGIIHVKENCYGWHGPWAGRSGWQQISDACCGVSAGYGRAMGLDAAVTPVFPNSDYCTGISGSVAVLHALIRRAEHGGSYGVDVALNYYSRWLTRSVGEYPENVWQGVWQQHGKPVFQHFHNMSYTLPAMLKLLRQNAGSVVFKPEFFARQTSKVLGRDFIQVKPICQFTDIDLGYRIGTRGNGRDEPRWPDDLTVEVVEQTVERA